MGFCATMTLQHHEPMATAAKPLRCRSWQCEECRPDRAKELIAMAIKGKATAFLTLTVSAESGTDPNDRARNLVKAWRRLRAEISANLSLPEHDRWQTEYLDSGGARFKDVDRAAVTDHDLHALPYVTEFATPNPRWKTARKALRLAQRDKEKMRAHSVEFLAVVEAQKNGEPHLHIMMRSPFVPQAWLSARMDELIRAPIVWIESVRKTKKLANYVAKYCGKDPHRFGTLKRYWASKRWVPKMQRDKPLLPDPDCWYSRSNLTIDQWLDDARRMHEHVIRRRKWWLALRADHPDYRTAEDDAPY